MGNQYLRDKVVIGLVKGTAVFHTYNQGKEVHRFGVSDILVKYNNLKLEDDNPEISSITHYMKVLQEKHQIKKGGQL